MASDVAHLFMCLQWMFIFQTMAGNWTVKDVRMGGTPQGQLFSLSNLFI